jgi:hypothetical protein
MSGIVFGVQLETVDRQRLSSAEKDLIRRMMAQLQPMIRTGWLLVGKEPPTLLHVETRDRRIVILKGQSSSPMKGRTVTEQNFVTELHEVLFRLPVSAFGEAGAMLKPFLTER